MNQVLLVLGSMVLLLLLSVVVNNAIINKAQEEYQADGIIAATTMAHAMLQEVSLRAFDEATVDSSIKSLSVLSEAGYLGPEGEKYPFFDDIDDYNGLEKKDTVTTGYFKTTVAVDYVSSSNPEAKAYGQTYFKRVTVTVLNPETMTIPVTLSTIISY